MLDLVFMSLNIVKYEIHQFTPHIIKSVTAILNNKYSIFFSFNGLVANTAKNTDCPDLTNAGKRPGYYLNMNNNKYILLFTIFNNSRITSPFDISLVIL